MEKYSVVGVMSGTSLDGVDMALCTFIKKKEKWSFIMYSLRTEPYSKKWKEILSTLHSKSAEEFALTHVQYGKYLGELIKKFLGGRKPDFVSSHGHTVFHQPSRQFTFQIGDGAALSVASGLPVVCDFRSTDVALKGQGAPLVPIGDKLLFSEYEYCLNLGGIANISLTPSPSPKERGGRKVQAFDVCPCNIILNGLANQLRKQFDKDGALARKGKVNNQLLKQLNNRSYYKKKFPKSLGREDIERDFLPVIHSSKISVEDKLCTVCEHIAMQIGAVANRRNSQLLVSGGGTYNKFLIERIAAHSKAKIIIPHRAIIEWKEAIIFGFLGVLRWRGEINSLKSVTGAERDSVGGAIYV